jgi:hypothetical protein
MGKIIAKNAAKPVFNNTSVTRNTIGSKPGISATLTNFTGKKPEING